MSQLSFSDVEYGAKRNELPRVSRRLVGFNHATVEHSC